MFTEYYGMQHIQGIDIINDTGIFSDHCLVATKIDLGIKNSRYAMTRRRELIFDVS